MFDLSSFDENDAKRLGEEIIKCAKAANDLHSAAEEIVRFLFENLRESATNEKSLVLARLFITLPFGELNGNLNKIAVNSLGGKDSPTNFTRCLVLLATAGIEPAWNDITKSEGHQVILLRDRQAVNDIPMISRMLTQFGLDLDAILSVDPDALRQWRKANLNAFHIPVAQGSPYIPAQEDFILPYNVHSVLGCGGIMRSTNFFSLILFSKTKVPDTTASAFRQITRSIKTALDIG